MHTRTSHSHLARTFSVAAPRAGFTLVEMLVSVTLVLMMMMMFAEVFEIATGIHVKIRGMSKNDQRTRILSTLLRSDLDKLTIRNATPFRLMEDRDFTIADRDLANRQGYLYVSENNPASDLDDVLQFTASADLRLGDFTDSTLFSGKSVNLRNRGLRVIFDQPDWDDGHENHASESVTAEISYFVRAGRLYRRVLMLRPPHTNNSPQPRIDEDRNQNNRLDPHEDWNGNGILDRGKEVMTYFSGSFWNDFDYSAHWNNEIGEKDANGNGVLDPDEDFNRDGNRNIGGVMFHGTTMLNNSVNIPNDRKPTNEESAMGIRAYRFGHSLHRKTYYRAREFDDNSFFIGRFTHEETSHPLFLYPTMSSNSPHDFGLTNYPVELSPDGVVARFQNGPRRSEDLLMTNVHSFDVKILRASHANPGYLELYDEDFDTRHPRDSHLLASEDVNGDGHFNHGNADGQLAPGEDVNFDCHLNKGNGDGFLNQGNGNGVLDTEDLNGNNVLDLGEDLNGNGVLDYGEDVNQNGVLDPGEDWDEDVNNNGVFDPGEDFDEDINPKNGKLDRDEDKDGDCKLDTEDTNRNGQLDAGEDINFNGLLDLGEDFEEDVNGNNHSDTYIPHRWTPYMHVARPPQWPLSHRLPSEDLNGNGRLDPGEDLPANGGNNNGQLDFFYNEDRNGNGTLDGNEDVNNNGKLDHYVVRAWSKRGRNGIWFRPMFKNNNVRFGRTGFREPEWPSRLGLAHDRRSTSDWRGRAYDGSVRWQAIPDRHRAMGIQITVRLLDPQSGQLRQVTILHPITGK